MNENRKHLRITSRLRCWCEGENVTFFARVGNISEGGLFLRTSTPLARGSRAFLRLKSAEASEIQAAATVVWARGEESDGPAGMGLQFEPLDSSTVEHLRRIIVHEQKAAGLGD